MLPLDDAIDDSGRPMAVPRPHVLDLPPGPGVVSTPSPAPDGLLARARDAVTRALARLVR